LDGAILVDFMITTLFVLAGRGGNEKPTTVSSRGFLPKFVDLRSTRPAGRARYDDDLQRNLSNYNHHIAWKVTAALGPVKSVSGMAELFLQEDCRASRK